MQPFCVTKNILEKYKKIFVCRVNTMGFEVVSLMSICCFMKAKIFLLANRIVSDREWKVLSLQVESILTANRKMGLLELLRVFCIR